VAPENQLNETAERLDTIPLEQSYLDIDSAGGELTLESILAEYKGTAYIDGDKRTPPAVLQEKTNKIVSEVIGAPASTAGTQAPETTHIKTDGVSAPRAKSVEKEPPGERTAVTLQSEEETTREPAPGNDASRDVIAFNKYRVGTAGEVGAAIDTQTLIEEETKKSARKFFGLFGGNKNRQPDVDWPDEDELSEPPADEEPIIEEETFEEPEFKQAAKRFAEGCNRYSMRSLISLLLSVIMAILTLIFGSGASLPFGIGGNPVVLNGIHLIFLLGVMMLSIDKLLQGITDLFKKGPGVEFLNLVSCVATIAAAAYSMLARDAETGMPYCVVSAFTLTFTLWGEKIYYRALTETMKTVLSVSQPYGIVAEMCDDLNKTIIKKALNRTSGFYNNLVQADIGETAYRYASPIFVVAAIALGFYASIGHELSKHVLHNIAAVMAAAAPFSAMMTFSVPFNAVARRARKSGAAIAGWGGADDLYHSDGASITDDDLFPIGTVTLGGIKIFEEVSPEKALRYTASLIIASNSGLSRLFSDQLGKNGINMIRVEDFTIFEGGIGGTIKGEHVIAGSAAFMNLMGIRIPASLNMKNAIFTAANKKLIAVFAVNYVPVKSVQNALISILRYRVKLFFAMRDFNITPVMLEQKYKVPVDDVEYIPIRDSYDISDATKHEAKRVSAILTREGLGPFAEAITGGRRLRTTSLAATVFSLFSAVAGMLLMFIICWTGSYTSASASNLLLYMLAMLLIVVIIAGFAKYRQ
jgi:hypothetical protein